MFPAQSPNDLGLVLVPNIFVSIRGKTPLECLPSAEHQPPPKAAVRHPLRPPVRALPSAVSKHLGFDKYILVTFFCSVHAGLRRGLSE